jgi:hypothetical protein
MYSIWAFLWPREVASYYEIILCDMSTGVRHNRFSRGGVWIDIRYASNIGVSAAPRSAIIRRFSCWVQYLCNDAANGSNDPAFSALVSLGP